VEINGDRTVIDSVGNARSFEFTGVTNPVGLLVVRWKGVATAGGATGWNYVNLKTIDYKGRPFVDASLGTQMRVNSVINDNGVVGTFTNPGKPFVVGQYIKVPATRVAPWVLYGDDPTSLIDHLRSTRD
jgi:hypothetical protein